MKRIFEIVMVLFVLVSFLSLAGVCLAEEYSSQDESKEEKEKKEEKEIKKEKKAGGYRYQDRKGDFRSSY